MNTIIVSSVLSLGLIASLSASETQNETPVVHNTLNVEHPNNLDKEVEKRNSNPPAVQWTKEELAEERKSNLKIAKKRLGLDKNTNSKRKK
jgi:hypothetical protein